MLTTIQGAAVETTYTDGTGWRAVLAPRVRVAICADPAGTRRLAVSSTDSAGAFASQCNLDVLPDRLYAVALTASGKRHPRQSGDGAFAPSDLAQAFPVVHMVDRRTASPAEVTPVAVLVRVERQASGFDQDLQVVQVPPSDPSVPAVIGTDGLALLLAAFPSSGPLVASLQEDAAPEPSVLATISVPRWRWYGVQQEVGACGVVVALGSENWIGRTLWSTVSQLEPLSSYLDHNAEVPSATELASAVADTELHESVVLAFVRARRMSSHLTSRLDPSFGPSSAEVRRGLFALAMAHPAEVDAPIEDVGSRGWAAIGRESRRLAWVRVTASVVEATRAALAALRTAVSRSTWTAVFECLPTSSAFPSEVLERLVEIFADPANGDTKSRIRLARMAPPEGVGTEHGAAAGVIARTFGVARYGDTTGELAILAYLVELGASPARVSASALNAGEIENVIIQANLSVPETYISDLQAQVEQTWPTHYFAEVLATQQADTTDINAAATIRALADSGFDLERSMLSSFGPSTHPFAWQIDPADMPAVTARIRRYQIAYRAAGSPEKAKTAIHIARTQSGSRPLVEAPELSRMPEASAAALLKRAGEPLRAGVLRTRRLRSGRAARRAQRLAAAQAAQHATPAELEALQTSAGADGVGTVVVDACGTDPAVWMTSPAAYLVDLLSFVGRVDSAGADGLVQVAERRPEILTLKLNGPNTYTEVPTIDLVNELLERAVDAGFQVPHPEWIPTVTEGSAAERRATPQITGFTNAVNEALATSLGGRSLPFVPQVDEYRYWFARENLERAQLVRAALVGLATPDEKSEFAMERLGFYPAEVELWTSGSVALTESWWGGSVGLPSAWKSMARFKEFTGLSEEDCDRVTQCFSVDPHLRLSWRPVDPLSSACDRANWQLTASGRVNVRLSGSDTAEAGGGRIWLPDGTLDLTASSAVVPLDAGDTLVVATSRSAPLVGANAVGAGGIALAAIVSGPDGRKVNHDTHPAMSVFAARTIRLIRLARATGWSIFQCDRVITAVGPRGPSSADAEPGQGRADAMTVEELQRLGALAQLVKRTGFAPEVVADWYAGIETRGRIDATGTLLAARWDRLFRNPERGITSAIFDLAADGRQLVASSTMTTAGPTVLSAVGLAPSDLDLLGRSAAAQALLARTGETLDFSLVTVPTVSALQRLAELRAATGLTTADLLELVSCSRSIEADRVFREPEETLSFLTDARAVSRLGLRTGELSYLTRHRVPGFSGDDATAEAVDRIYINEALTNIQTPASSDPDVVADGAVAAWLGVTQDFVRQIRAAWAVSTYPTSGEARRTYLHRWRKLRLLQERLGWTDDETATFAVRCVDVTGTSGPKTPWTLLQSLVRESQLAENLRPYVVAATDSILCAVFGPSVADNERLDAIEALVARPEDPIGVAGLTPPIRRFRAALFTSSPEGLSLDQARELLSALIPSLSLRQRYGIDLTEALTWGSAVLSDLASASSIAASIRGAVLSRMDEPTRLEVSRAYWDPMRAKRRDAMVQYLRSRNTAGNGFDPAELLTDVDVGVEQTTSRVVFATTALQTWVNRTILGLNTGFKLEPIPLEEWDWMGRYRVWEANRKILLYPENWADPELVTGSPEFERWKTQTSQPGATARIVEDEFGRYLKGLASYSNLTIVAVHQTRAPSDDLHVIARTSGERGRFLYRVRSSGRWTPWRDCGVDFGDAAPSIWAGGGEVWVAWMRIQPASIDDAIREINRKYASHGVESGTQTWVRWTASPRVVRTLGAMLGGEPMPVDNLESLPSEAVVGPHQVVLSTARWTGSTFEAVGPEFPLDTDADLWWEFRRGETPVSHPGGYYKLSSRRGWRYLMSRPEQTAPSWILYRSLMMESGDLMDAAPEARVASLEDHGVTLATRPVVEMEVRSNALRVTVLSPTVEEYGCIWGATAAHVPGWRPLSAPGSRRPEVIGYTWIETLLSEDFQTPGIPEYGASTLPDGSVHIMNEGNAIPILNKGAGGDRFVPDSAAGYYRLTSWEGGFAVSSAHGAYIHTPDQETSAREWVLAVFGLYAGWAVQNLGLVGATEMLKAYGNAGVRGVLSPHQMDAPPVQALALQAVSGANYHVTFGMVADDETPLADNMSFDLRAPGASYYWETFVHLPLLASQRLKSRRQYRDARNWLLGLFDPRSRTYSPSDLADCWHVAPLATPDASDWSAAVDVSAKDPFDPIAVLYTRWTGWRAHVKRAYVELHLDWADDLFRQDSQETIAEAVNLYLEALRILGPRPIRPLKGVGVAAFSWSDIVQDDAPEPVPVGLEDALAPLDVPSLDRFAMPPNELAMVHWDRIQDRLYKIHNSLTIDGQFRRLALFAPPIDPAMLVRARAMGMDIPSITSALTESVGPLRFSAALSHAFSLVGELRTLNNTLLSVLEKRDAEALARLRTTHESAVFDAEIETRTLALSEARTQLHATQQSLSAAEQRLQFWTDRLAERRSPMEVLSMTATAAVPSLYGTAQALHAGEGALKGTGWLSLFGPIVGGASVGESVEAGAAVVQAIANTLNTVGQIAGVEGAFVRRDEDWKFQQTQARSEVKNLKAQLTASETRVLMAERELSLTRTRASQSAEVAAFLTNKFTNERLYGWLETRVRELIGILLDRARGAVERARKAYQWELNSAPPNARFSVSSASFDALTEADTMMVALHELSDEYAKNNKRQLEITKVVSLAAVDPHALATLRQSGATEFYLEEHLFDRDFPTHYNRRIRRVSVSISAGVGAPASVPATATLLQHRTRERVGTATTLNPWGPPEAGVRDRIAISSGGIGSGIAPGTENDGRFLPFEGFGAISQWRIQMRGHSSAAQGDVRWSKLEDVVLELTYRAEDEVNEPPRSLEAPTDAEAPAAFVASLRATAQEAWAEATATATTFTLEVSAEHLGIWRNVNAKSIRVIAVGTDGANPTFGGPGAHGIVTGPSFTGEFTFPTDDSLRSASPANVPSDGVAARGTWSVAFSSPLPDDCSDVILALFTKSVD